MNKNFENFLKKAKEIHNEKYDYSKVKYVNSQTKIAIICPIHGIFFQKPNKHLLGQGCPECSIEKRKNKNGETISKKSFKNFEEFVILANKKHLNKYSYDETTFNNRLEKNKITITCQEHGDFEMTPSAHLLGQGCPKCGKTKKDNSLKSSKEEFVARAIKVHNNKYNYDKVTYKNAMSKIIITCQIHGDFKQTPMAHLIGQGCPKCKGRGLTQEDIIQLSKEIHGEKYDYSKSVFTKMREKMTIICPKHGEFEMTPSHHIKRKQGCPKCAIESKRMKVEEFVERAIKVHGTKYDYSKVKYKSTTTPVEIICPKHGSFNQLPLHHFQGCGCPSCSESTLERKVAMMLEEKGIVFEREKTFPWLRNKRPMFLDFYIPSLNIAIECQGEQHFKPIKQFGGEKEYRKRIENDAIKKKLCIENDVNLLYFSNNKTELYNVITDINDLYNELNV